MPAAAATSHNQYLLLPPSGSSENIAQEYVDSAAEYVDSAAETAISSRFLDIYIYIKQNRKTVSTWLHRLREVQML
jgi:hypothetical protein